MRNLTRIINFLIFYDIKKITGDVKNLTPLSLFVLNSISDNLICCEMTAYFAFYAQSQGLKFYSVSGTFGINV